LGSLLLIKHLVLLLLLLWEGKLLLLVLVLSLWWLERICILLCLWGYRLAHLCWRHLDTRLRLLLALGSRILLLLLSCFLLTHLPQLPLSQRRCRQRQARWIREPILWKKRIEIMVIVVVRYLHRLDAFVFDELILDQLLLI
jgi:hypothetical protein